MDNDFSSAASPSIDIKNNPSDQIDAQAKAYEQLLGRCIAPPTIEWNWLCRFGIHLWKGWREMETVSDVSLFSVTVKSFYQTRTCYKCNKTQRAAL